MGLKYVKRQRSIIAGTRRYIYHTAKLREITILSVASHIAFQEFLKHNLQYFTKNILAQINFCYANHSINMTVNNFFNL